MANEDADAHAHADAIAEEDASPTPEHEAPARPRRRRLLPLLFVVLGVLLAMFLGSKAPKEQHVRLSLGPSTSAVTAIEVSYLGSPEATEAVRATRLAYEAGKAPRIVALDPELPNGDYVLRLEITARGETRTVDRRVSLAGGTTSVDLGGVLDENRSAP